jgi:hypothetical protein
MRNLEKQSLGRQRIRWKENIEQDLREIGSEDVWYKIT